MTLKPKNDVRNSAFGLAIALAVIVSGSILAMQWRTGTQLAITLNESINPNTAPVASLLRLPGVGPIRAQAIVAYRQTHVLGHPKQTAYKCLKDLERIKGLGPRTVSALSPWLIFDELM
jgi:DNA uptake protein ComE-like DNA-binding protein